MYRSKLLPEEDQDHTQYKETDGTQQSSMLNGINFHTEEWYQLISAEGADPSTCDHAQESEEITANGIEGYMCCRIFFRKIHVQNISVGEVQTYVQNLLEECCCHIERLITRRQREHGKFRRYEEQYRNTKGFDPRKSP